MLKHTMATVAWVGACIVALIAFAAPSNSAIVETSTVDPAESCAARILADLDVWAETARIDVSGGIIDVPAPRWEWVVNGCRGIETPGVYGHIRAYEDDSYEIQGYGDVWHGCMAGGLCRL